MFTAVPWTLTARILYEYDPLYRLTGATYRGGADASYVYDDNGNLTTIYPPGSDVQYPTGALAYTYNQRNLMTGHSANPDGTAWITQAAYAYDGAGDRLQQVDYTSGSAIATTYSNDALGLTQVLAADDGTEQVYNLYGLDLIAQDDGTEIRTLLADGLGSARTEMVGPAVETVTTYSPYGKLPAQTGSDGSIADATYGFTGEQHDDATGLLYLRARYYNPALKRFQNRDPWKGTGWRPETLNYYTYGYANPSNHTDPSGRNPWGCQTPDCRNNPRDLKLWLFREMKVNVNDPVVNSLRTKNRLGKGGMVIGAGAFALGCWADGPLPLVEIGSGIVFVGSGLVYGNALLQFRDQVKNGARWDFKDEIGFKIGPGFTLCSSGICDSEIEYSVPGNIFFGYIGRAAGFTGLELQAGAGWAEWRDPAHDPSSTEYAGPYKGEVDIGRSLPKLWNLGDEPTDHEAVTLGILLWDRYGTSVTLAQFKATLSGSISRLAHESPDSEPVSRSVAKDWPYPLGYFNNVGRVYVP